MTKIEGFEKQRAGINPGSLASSIDVEERRYLVAS